MAVGQARHWRSAAQALAYLRRRSTVTRTVLADLLGQRSGPASDLMKRLASVRLVSERPAVAEGRGRPTTTVHAHPEGPVAVVLDLRHGDWRLGTCDLDGEVRVVEVGRHDGAVPEELLAELGGKVSGVAGQLGQRAVGVGVAAPGMVVDSRLSLTMLGWPEVDTSPLRSALDLPLLVANDATMAAVAEARMHPADLAALLHIVVEVGIGGALIADGQPVPSAHGLQGEFGHLPMGNPALACPCGAWGCWNVAFHLGEISRRLDAGAVREPRAWLHHLYTHAAETATSHAVVRELAADLGRGVAGLVNALDPGLVTLGGMAHLIRESFPAAFDAAFERGLMNTHRVRPPRVLAARAGDDAALVGAGLSVFDRVLDAEFLARWASDAPPTSLSA